ncbi:hypothetical protein OPV22_032951 [Ensete ventricosum]|uniref:Uncharacterized protein n=1 Tax=Ensete ventricosum TaxID=4639 RepID=A0AAV8PQP3_ENSVE|nr:hypothetical protein OPV22_032951 [Ensete ventricosum]
MRISTRIRTKLSVTKAFYVFLLPNASALPPIAASRGRSPEPAVLSLALSGSAASDLMAFSFGFTRFVLSSHPDTAREILNSSAFADRPVKESSAYDLLFHRAMGFAPFAEYSLNLRRIAAFGEHRKTDHRSANDPRRNGKHGDEWGSANAVWTITVQTAVELPLWKKSSRVTVGVPPPPPHHKEL